MAAPALGPVLADQGPVQNNWECLTKFRRVLNDISEAPVLQPLKSTMDKFGSIIDVNEGKFEAIAHEDYATLKAELEETFSALSTNYSGKFLPSMTAATQNLCGAIMAELEGISVQDNTLTAREVPDRVLECYRRIQGNLERLKLNTDVSILEDLDNHVAEARLTSLEPSMAASYDSLEARQGGRKERAPKTCRQVISTLASWVHKESQTSMYWMRGETGTGKTTIASTLCTVLDGFHELGASFFCTRLLPTCRKVELVLPTIAYQLAQFSCPFYYALSSVLREDSNRFNKTIPSQLDDLIINPLCQVAATLPTSLVVVIDALDECEDQEGVEVLLNMLAQSISKLPVKIFISTLPKLQILYDPRSLDAGSQLILDELEDAIVKEDVKSYMSHEFKSHNIPIRDADVTVLVERAGAQFSYAAACVRYVKTATSDLARQQRVQKVLETDRFEYQNKCGAIDALYTVVLATAFEDPDLGETQKAIMELVLHTVVCSREPFTAVALANILGFKENTSVLAALESLRPVLCVSTSSGVVTPLHTSFLDYMLDVTRSHKYGCQARQHHDRLAGLCLDRLKDNKPQSNICQLESPFVPDEQVLDLEERVDRAVKQDLLYACQYWAFHLELGGLSVRRLMQLEEFLLNQLLLWMEILNLKKYISISTSILARIVVWCQDQNVPSYTQNLVHDAWKFATTFVMNDVSRSTPHLYVSMLTSWPSPGSPMDSMQRIGRVPRVGGTGTWRSQPALIRAINTNSQVVSVTFSPNGTRVASGFSDNAIRVWDPTSGSQLLNPLLGHTDCVNSVAFSPDNVRIASGSNDNTIRVWDTMNGQQMMGPLVGHTAGVKSVHFSFDGARIVSGSVDKTIRVWDATSGMPAIGPILGHKEWVNSVQFSPDGSHIVSGSFDKTIRVWDAASGKLALSPLKGHTHWVISVAFSPDGRRIVSGSFDRTIRVWDATNGVQLMSPLLDHISSINSVAYSPNGMYVVFGSFERSILVLDAMNGKPLMGPLIGHIHGVNSVAFSPDSRRIVSGSFDKSVRVWGVTSSEPITVWRNSTGHGNWVSSVAFSPDGSRIISGSVDKTICVWDATNGEPLMSPLVGHTHWVTSVAISPNGMYIASCSVDKTVRVWDSATGKLVTEPLLGHTHWVNSVAFAPNNTCIASGSSDKTIRMWSVTSSKPTTSQIIGHSGPIHSVSFSPDGTRIVSGSLDCTIRVWDAANRKAAIEPLLGHTGCVNLVAFSPNGARIVSGSFDRTIRVWDAMSGELVIGPILGHTHFVNSVAFSADGRRIASGLSDNTIRVWDAMSGKTAMEPLIGHFALVSSVAFSPDSTRIASGSFDKVIRLWDSCSQLSEFEAPDFLEQSLQVTSDTRTLNRNGWVLGQNAQLLQWIPANLRPCTRRPYTTRLIATEGPIELDFQDAGIGDYWSENYISL